MNVRTCCSASTFVGTRIGRLPPGADHLEDGPERNLRLAVSDVAAEQAVHRLVALEVAPYGARRGGLVGRVGEGERLVELALPIPVGRERRGDALHAGGLGVEEIVREILDGGRDLLLALPPLRGAELRQSRRAAGPDVALHEIDARDGHVDPRALGELEMQELAFALLALEGDETPEHPDPVVEVHDGRADLELEEVLDRTATGAAAGDPPLAERQVREVVVGNVRRAGRIEAEGTRERAARRRWS